LWISAEEEDPSGPGKDRPDENARHEHDGPRHAQHTVIAVRELEDQPPYSRVVPAREGPGVAVDPECGPQGVEPAKCYAERPGDEDEYVHAEPGARVRGRAHCNVWSAPLLSSRAARGICFFFYLSS
jgi:hypothetical protein